MDLLEKKRKENQTYLGRKIDKILVWTAVERYDPGILAIQIGDRSGETFDKLWQPMRSAITFLVMNLSELLRQIFCLFYAYLKRLGFFPRR